MTGKTALHEAVLSNNIGMTRMLLKMGADPNVGHAATVSRRWERVGV